MYFIATVLVIILSPSLAEAWGGITHLEYAHGALAVLSGFPLAVKKLLMKETKHFLYGSVAADITLGKNLRGYIYNCHNWRVALDLLQHQAKSNSQKAFMLGYLSHLAADTVAHNFFVPYRLILSWKNRFFQHVYWEIRMDLTVDTTYWKLLEDFLHDDFSDDDALLEGHLKKTFFSFKTNKKIFNGLIALQQFKKYKEFVFQADQKSSLTLTKQDILNYKTLAQNAVIDFLKNLDQSYCLDADPTGKLKMLYARDATTQLRALSKKGELTPKKEYHLLKLIKQHLQESIYTPNALPHIKTLLGERNLAH